MVSVIDSSAQSVPIVPAPQQVAWGEGFFPLEQAVTINSSLTLPLTSAHLLNEVFAERDAESELQIHLGLLTADPFLLQLCQERKLAIEQLDQEGYHLLIEATKIFLVAKTQKGVFYGLQSLKQLTTAYRKTGKLPVLQITDFPTFRNRAVMDDISRGPLSNMRFLKEQIRKLAALKVNQLTFYIEHVVKTKSHPGFAPEDAITIAEFEELSKYAKDYHIELIGSFQSLGHFRNILQHPNYQKLGASERMLKPATPESFEFLQAVYSEMIPAFSSPFFNINADEAWDLVRGSMQSVADSIGPGHLYGQHVQPLLRFLQDQGKQPMIWGDMLIAHPEAFAYLPEGTTVLTWEYGALTDYSAWIDPLQNRQLDFWVCPGILNSYKIIPDVAINFTNLRHFIAEGHAKGAKGVMTTTWDDGGGHLFARDWYPLAYAAEQMWQPNAQSSVAFDQRFAKALYADEATHLPRIIRLLNQIKELPSAHQLNNVFFEEQLLPHPGDAHQLYLEDVTAILSITREATQLLDAWQQVGYPTDNPWTKDIASWRFLMDHLTLLGNSYLAVLELAEGYQTYYAQPSRAQQQLQQLYDKAHQFRNDWEQLRQRYIALWFRENRAYSLETATEIFDQKVQDFFSLETLLEQCLIWPSTSPLPPPAQLRLAISENPDRHFRFWLLSPVFPLTNGQAAAQDFLGELGGELAARPTPYDWLKYQSPYSDKIDFQQSLSVADSSVVYTYVRIESPEDQTVKSELGHELPIAIFLNGEQLDMNNSSSKEDLHTIQLPLKAGKNHLILKFLCTGKRDRFSFLLPEEAVRNRKQKYTLQR